MGQWLVSGRRRDLCVLLYGTDGQTTQELKRGLEAHYETYVSPEQFHGTLEALRKQGYVERTVDGTSERYHLTDHGEAAVAAHYQWLSEELADE